MVVFSESFVGGFFGFGRTYGAVAQFHCESADELEADWAAALRDVTTWRARRGDRATALHLYATVPPAGAWGAAAFLVARLVVPPADRPIELRGLVLEMAVFGHPDMEQYLDLTIYPE